MTLPKLDEAFLLPQSPQPPDPDASNESCVGNDTCVSIEEGRDNSNQEQEGDADQELPQQLATLPLPPNPESCASNATYVVMTEEGSDNSRPEQQGNAEQDIYPITPTVQICHAPREDSSHPRSGNSDDVVHVWDLPSPVEEVPQHSDSDEYYNNTADESGTTEEEEDSSSR